MERNQKRKYSVYKIMQQALDRSGIKDSGSTATILLEGFLEMGGRLRSDSVYPNVELCVKGSDYQFIDWRDELVSKDWLRYEYIKISDTKTTVKYYPGSKLVAYLNKEKLKREEIATKRELEETRNELGELRSEQDTFAKKADLKNLEDITNKQGTCLNSNTEEIEKLKNEMGIMRKTVMQLIEEYDPPGTEEKVDARLRLIKEN